MRVQTGGDRVRDEKLGRAKRTRVGGALYPAAWRMLAALAFAGALLLVLPGALQWPTTSVSGSAHLLEGFSSAVAGDDLAGWDESFSWTAGYAQALPEGFAAEVLALEGVDAKVSDRGSVVGYCVDGDPEAVGDSVRDELSSRGWTAVESGADTLRTYVKGSGRYRWASVSCTGVGDATSVVVVAKGVEANGRNE